MAATKRPFIVGANEPVLIGEGHLRKMTDKAIEVVLDSGRVLWIPISVCHEDSELYGRDTEGKKQPEGEHGMVVLKRWWCVERLGMKP